MFNLNPTSPGNFQTTYEAVESFSDIQSPQLPNEVLQMIFDGFERSELLKIRGVCSDWNNYVLDVLASRSIRKIEKHHNFINFLSFLKENLAGYPNESEKINKDLETLKICHEKHSKKIIPFFKALSRYNLETRVAETLKNIRVIDLRNLIRLSENQIAPNCSNILKTADAFQQLFLLSTCADETAPLLDGMNFDDKHHYVLDESTSIDTKALDTNRYDIGIEEAIEFSSLPIKKARGCPDSFFATWSDAKKILEHILHNRNLEPERFDFIDGVYEASYCKKCAIMCQDALAKNKFKRLVKALKEKQEIIATLFIIRYLEAIGENDRTSQIEVLLKPGTMQFAETAKPATELSDFWTEKENTENIAQIGKREKEDFHEPFTKKAKKDCAL